MAEQIPFGTDGFADNPGRRNPCVLLLDTSTSMEGERIDELNAGLELYAQEIKRDPLAIKQVEIAIVTFGPVRVVSDFVLAQDFQPPKLTADGDTPLGAALLKGIELVNGRKETYRQHGIDYYRPWIFLFTDGEPTDSWEPAAEAIHSGETAKAFAFFPIGIEGAKMSVLSRLSSQKQPLRLRGLRFAEFFRWLSKSQGRASATRANETAQLDNPTGPSGWGEA